MITGITPIDGAFELIGLCNCQQLTLFIFKQTMGGALVFAVGFIFSLWAVASKGTFKPFFTFLILFFSLWLLFVVPAIQAPSATSTMEQNGYTGLTTAQVLSNNSQSLSNNNGTINPILNIISDTFSAFTIGCVAVIEKGADPGKSNYLKNPFLIQKLETIASQTVSEGIKDPKLRKEVSDFYKNYYLSTLQKLIEDKSYTVANIPQLWPGDPAIIAEYSPEASSAWTTVKNDILSNIGTQSGIPNNG